MSFCTFDYPSGQFISILFYFAFFFTTKHYSCFMYLYNKVIDAKYTNTGTPTNTNGTL